MTALLAVLLPLGLAACGSSAPDDPDAGRAASQWRGCTLSAFEAAGGSVGAVTAASGAPARVKLPQRGPCAGGLVAEVDAGVVGLDVTGLELDPETAGVVRLAETPEASGPSELLRVDGGRHPRGGFQPHLFTVSDEIAEITVGGAPLVPFVATDGGMSPMTVRCGPDGTLQVLQATTSEPPGVIVAWDVETTTYDVGPPAKAVATEQVREDVADPVLRRERPDLFAPGALFGGC